MAAKTDGYVPCPKCGKQALLPRVWRRDANLTITCGVCGHIHLALNAVRLRVHDALVQRGIRAIDNRPAPLPIAPVEVVPSAGGTSELVIRRNKKGGERIYYRRTKPKPINGNSP